LINEHSESFLCPTAYWSPSDYIKSWEKNLDSFKQGIDSYFATKIEDPEVANFFVVWPAFFLDGVPVLTEKLLFKKSGYNELCIEDIPLMIDFEMLRSLADSISTFAVGISELSSGQVLPLPRH
jgi:hypothetical protein